MPADDAAPAAYVPHDDPAAVHFLVDPDAPMTYLMVCGQDDPSLSASTTAAGVTCAMCATGIERAGDPARS
jgi:hypothetical protein